MRAPPLWTHEAALGGEDFDAARDRLAEAHGSEEMERRRVDALHVALAQGLVLAALHARAHRRLLDRNGAGPQCPARLAPTSSPRQILDYSHSSTPQIS